MQTWMICAVQHAADHALDPQNFSNIRLYARVRTPVATATTPAAIKPSRNALRVHGTRLKLIVKPSDGGLSSPLGADDMFRNCSMSTDERICRACGPCIHYVFSPPLPRGCLFIMNSDSDHTCLWSSLLSSEPRNKCTDRSPTRIYTLVH